MHLEVDEGFVTHRKTLRFCGMMQDHNAYAYLIRLWAWAVRGAPDGNLGDLTPVDIETIVQYRNLDGRCYTAMATARFVDEREPGLPGAIHNWMRRTGASIHRLMVDAEAKRKYRQHQKNDGSCGGVDQCEFCARAVRPSTTRPTERPQIVDPNRGQRVLGPSQDDRVDVGDSTDQDRSGQDRTGGSGSGPPPDPLWMTDKEIWGPSRWADMFGRAWAAAHSVMSYGGCSGPLCGRLGDLLERLSRPELVDAQRRAPLMFAVFLGNRSPKLVMEKHPFAFFIQSFDALRVDEATLTKGTRLFRGSGYPEAE